jgi:hypothetical protein
VRTWVSAGVLTTIFYSTVIATWSMAGRVTPSFIALPERVLEPFRIANGYGLFANMTPARYEIEFQGTRDGTTWIAYPFRYKPQDVREHPGVFAPYQPRFDWNLWFASLASWRQSQWVVLCQMRLMQSSPSVLKLFRDDPFHGAEPVAVRTVLWQYWFTNRATKRATGQWWERRELGPFAGTLERRADGTLELLQAP